MAASGSPVGDFLSSFSTSFTKRKDYLRQKQALDEGRDAYRADMYAGGYQGSDGGNSGAVGPAAGRRAMSVADPASVNMPSYQRAFLNTIAGPESNGAYDVRYSPQGGKAFDPEQGHPRIFEPTKEGKKSSAAGRYQFTWTTWKGLAGADTPFTPENQDQYAWKLAVQDYSRNSGGRDLAADLQSGVPVEEIMGQLGGTWEAFQNRERLPEYARVYADSMARYSTPTAPVARSINSPLGLSLGTAQ